MEFTQNDEGVIITLPQSLPEAADTIVKIRVDHRWKSRQTQKSILLGNEDRVCITEQRINPEQKTAEELKHDLELIIQPASIQFGWESSRGAGLNPMKESSILNGWTL